MTINDDLRRELEYAYLAGYLDGEGCFRLNVTGAPKKRQPTVTVKSVDMVVIHLLRERFGGSFHLNKSAQRRYPHRKVVYEYKLMCSKGVEPLLRAILPYLTIKKAQAEILLEFIEGRTQKYHRWTPLTPEEHARREMLASKLSDLKKVPVHE